MANRRHVVRLKRGVEVWNQWRTEHPNIEPDLSDTDLNGIEGSGLDLRDANLSRAHLSKSNFRDANLCRSNLKGTNLQGVDLRGANLFRTNFSGANLRAADFGGADLRGADFSDAVLDQADFKGADLRTAYLHQTQAFATNFTEANLTSTCIEGWHVNELTQLHQVVCDCIYLKPGYQERRPLEGDFAPGDLAKLFQDSTDTLELIFQDGINWEIFAYTFQRILLEKPEIQMTLRNLEARRNGTVIAQLDLDADVDSYRISDLFMQVYEFFCTGWSHLNPAAENSDKGGAHNLNPLVKTIHTLSQKLGQGNILIAQEIQHIFNNLGKTHTAETIAEQTMIVAKALEEIERTPTLRQQIMDLLNEDGGDSLRQMLKMPMVDTLIVALSSNQNHPAQS